MNNDHEQDTRQLEIQRLIDGELSHTERAELLRALDATPEMWRSVSLGFVEAQLIRESVGKSPQDRIGTSRLRLIQPMFRAAALVAIGLAGGLLLSRSIIPRSLPSSSPSVLADVGNTSAASDNLTERPTSDQDPIAAETLELARSRIGRVSEAVSREGYRPTLETTLLQTDLGNGRSLVIPINRLSIASTE